MKWARLLPGVGSGLPACLPLRNCMLGSREAEINLRVSNQEDT